MSRKIYTIHLKQGIDFPFEDKEATKIVLLEHTLASIVTSLENIHNIKIENEKPILYFSFDEIQYSIVENVRRNKQKEKNVYLLMREKMT